MDAAACQICLCGFGAGAEGVLRAAPACVNRCTQRVCEDCLAESLERFAGASRYVVNFPKCLECSARIPQKTVVKAVSKHCADEIETALERALQVRCSSCEEMQNFMVEAAPVEERIEVMKYFEQVLFVNDPEFKKEFVAISNRFLRGEPGTAMKLFDLVEEHREEFENELPVFTNKDGREADRFPVLAYFIQDRERRARMILDWLRRKQFVYTPCCSNGICFHCHTSWHEGRSCESFRNEMNGYDQDIDLRNCPHCNLTLEKTDGCDYVVCYCGESFNWSNEGVELPEPVVTKEDDSAAFSTTEFDSAAAADAAASLRAVESTVATAA